MCCLPKRSAIATKEQDLHQTDVQLKKQGIYLQTQITLSVPWHVSSMCLRLLVLLKHKDAAFVGRVLGSQVIQRSGKTISYHYEKTQLNKQ